MWIWQWYEGRLDHRTLAGICQIVTTLSQVLIQEGCLLTMSSIFVDHRRAVDNNSNAMSVLLAKKLMCRMGSFTSAPKIPNGDTQDDDKLQFPERSTRLQLQQICQRELIHLPPLLNRFFAQFHNKPWSKSAKGNWKGPVFRVMQWNILAQALSVQSDNFVACPLKALDWSTRRYRLLEEILLYLPDVICLQEVDHFKFLKRSLECLGYVGMFFPKPDSPCIYIPGNNGPDGCAILFNCSKFELVCCESRILEVLGVQSNQVVMMVTLRLRETGQEIRFATTHLKARQGTLLSTLRNEQGKDLLEFFRTNDGHRPLVICGDFNAEPTEPVYNTMLRDRRLNLASAYASFSHRKEEPPFTTWKIREDGESRHTIDYIFYTEKYMQVEALLQFPTEEDIGLGRVPSFSYPSDHFSLVTDFCLKLENEN